MEEHCGIQYSYVETSAKTGSGIDLLLGSMIEAVDYDNDGQGEYRRISMSEGIDLRCPQTEAHGRGICKC
jgi:hypothetical protein